MTISEQLREAALYAEFPWQQMRSIEFLMRCDYKVGDEMLIELRGADLRTFMLLVAEALE